MSKIRVRSYLDGNAPQFTGQDHLAFVKFLQSQFVTQSYNQQFFINSSVNLQDKRIELHFNPVTPHGFVKGNLLRIEGDVQPVFKGQYYRVVETTHTSITLKITNTDIVYPTSITGSSMFVEHAPLDWEVVYNSEHQISLRSKSEKSSKNVWTAKRIDSEYFQVDGTRASLADLYVSKDVDKESGTIISDYLSEYRKGNAGYNESTNNRLSTCFLRFKSGANYFTQSVNSDNVPWFILADDKFIYLYLGSYQTSNDPSRSSISRSLYVFGDPDFLGDPDVIDTTGSIFSCFYTPSSYMTTINSSLNTPQLSGHLNSTRTSNLTGDYLFLGSYDSSNTNIIPVSFSSIYTNSNSLGWSSFSYPNLPTNGLLFFPIYCCYTPSTSTNSGGYFRSKLPFVLTSAVDIRNLTQGDATLLDYVSFMSEEGKMLMPILSTSSTGMFFELD